MKTALQRLVGEKCWLSVAGEGTGSVFSLKFGDPFLLETPRSNPHLSENGRKHNSHLGLMVYSSWSLERQGEEICDSESDNRNDGPMVAGLKALEGRNLLAIDSDAPTEQITLHFEDEYQLDVFCDGFEASGEDATNYVIFLHGASCAAKSNGSIHSEDG